MKLICVILSVVLVTIDGARILAVFPTPSISHQVVFRPLTQELARRGHELVIITADPAYPKGETPENITEIDVHDVSYDLWRKNFVVLSSGKKNDLINQVEIGFATMVSVFFKQLEIPEVKKVIRGKEHFDLIFVETCVRPALVLSHVFKAPLISISSFGALLLDYDYMGAPTHPLLYPSALRQRLYNLTFWEKLSELYTHYAIENFFHKYEAIEDALLKEHFGEDTPSLHDLKNDISMMFLNMHPVFEGNHPVPNSILHIGGIHYNPPKELPKDLKSFLDSSKHGVIYVSFGTNVDPENLPPQMIQMFIRVLSQLPYDVLWKWNKDELPGKSQNIRIGKWFPQSDLLRHPKVKLFFTQGGLQSTDEAITAGVPLVGLPMLGDQWYNTEKYVHLKIGVNLNVETITEDIFRGAITKVIEDESYRNNIKKLSVLLRDQPMPPLERAVWWTEHVLRHSGAPHLRAPAANLSWAQYLELEFVLTLLLGLTVVVALSLFALYSVVRFVSRNFFMSAKLKET